MKYEIKEYEVEFNSQDFPQLSFQQFEQMVTKATQDFIQSMTKLNAQFISLQDYSPLGVQTKFFHVAGCLAVRQLYQLDVKDKNHFVRLEANALVQVDEIDALLPGETPLDQTQIDAAIGPQGRAH